MADESQDGARGLASAEIEADLDQPLGVGGELQRLERLLGLLGRAEEGLALFDRLHAAAVRDGRVAELSSAYEEMAKADSLQGLRGDLRAELFLHAARFSQGKCHDPAAAVRYAELALAATDGTEALLVHLDSILLDLGDPAQTAALYDRAASQIPQDVERQVRLLEHALRTLDRSPESAGYLLPLKERLVRLQPAEHLGWFEELRQQYESAGKRRELAALFEAALATSPPLLPAEARPLRLRLAAVYREEGMDRARALVHLEALALQAMDADFVRVAEPFLEQKAFAPRLVPLLSDAYELLGRVGDEIQCLTMELKLSRPPRLARVYRRLAVLRQDVLDDPAGALELLESLISREPGDDEIRNRYVAASEALGRDRDALRCLSHVLRNAPDEASRSRIAFDVARLFLRSGDAQQSQSSFVQVLDPRGDDRCRLAAARHLLEERDSLAPEIVVRALAAIADTEPDQEARLASAHELLRMGAKIELDTSTQISAWRALLDSPFERDALERLENLYEVTGNPVGLSEVLERRAALESDADRARELAFRGTELRAGPEVAPDRALHLWRHHVAQFGHSRAAHAKLIPLLQASGAYLELASVLAEEARLDPEAERAKTLAELADVRYRQLGDVPGALQALRASLEVDPAHASSRELLEKMLEAGETAAADLLEPWCEKEFQSERHAAQAFLRILDLRLESTEEAAPRAALWQRLGQVIDAGQLPSKTSLAACTRVLERLSTGHQELLSEWLDRVERFAGDDPSAAADAILSVCKDDLSDPRAASKVALSAARVLEKAGQFERALSQCEHAMELGTVSAELLKQMNALAHQLGQDPSRRIERYQVVLDRTTDPERRAELLYAIGKVEQTELSDSQSAIASWQRAFEANPKHWPSHLALVSAYEQEGDVQGLERELRRGLLHSDGPSRAISSVRLADALASWGRQAEALALLAPLLEAAALDDDLLETFERIAREADHADGLSRVLQLRLDGARSPADRARALERLGEFLDEWQGNPASAVQCWKEAARELSGHGGPKSEAIRLYERVLSAAPDDTDAAKGLVELYADAGDWSRVPEAFAALQRHSPDALACAELLLALEGAATEAGAVNEFAEMVAALSWGEGRSHASWARSLLCAKARVFAAASRYDEAADVCRTLLESYGEPADGQGVQLFEALIDASPAADWRRQNLRWLFEWRADHSADPVSVLLRWATVEERDFGDPQAAIVLLERATSCGPANSQVLEALIRLKMEGGEIDGGLDAFHRLREVAAPDESRSVAVRMVALLRGLGRTEAALAILAGLLEHTPRDRELRLSVSQFLSLASPTRERAAELLERASAAGDSVEQQQSVLEKLLEATAEQDEWEDTSSPTLRALRRGWFQRLLEFSSGQTAVSVLERAAFEFPEDERLWHALERFAGEADNPMVAVRCYERALARPLAAELAEHLGRLLLTFAEERAIDARELTGALERVLALSPGARWALDRVKLALTLDQRWEALFALYDGAVQAIEDEAERCDLLDEAAVAARDVVGDLERAVGYWEQLFELRPGDLRIDMVLERLYERRGQTEKLISHLSRRLGALGGVEQRQLGRRIALLWIGLGRGQPALDLTEKLLSEEPEDPAVYDLLERIVAWAVPNDETSPKATADRGAIRHAAQRLRQRYAQEARHEDIGRLLEVELAVCEDPSDRAIAASELLAHRLAQGDKSGAFECLGELMLLEPELPAHRAQLTALAAELGYHERLTSLLIAASERVGKAEIAAVLLEQAADVSVAPLHQPERAAELLKKVMHGSADSNAQARAGRALERLLSSLSRSSERCDVLERLTELEADPAKRQATLVEAARVAADELTDPLRAAEYLKRALKHDSSDPVVLDELVRVLRAGKSWSELCDALAARVRLRRHDPEARQDLAEIGRVFSDQLADPDRAIEIWRLVRKRYGNDDENRDALADLLERRERWEELATLLSEAAPASTTPAPLFSRLARVYRDHTGDVASAIEAHLGASEWGEATTLWELNAGALGDDSPLAARLVAALKGAGRYDEAERVLRRLLERLGRRSPKERGQLHCELAELLRTAGRSEAAMTELLAALAMHPADPKLLAAVGRLAHERGDLERAEQSYRMLLLVLRRPEDAAEARLSRAEVYVELSDIAERRNDADSASHCMASAFEVAVDAAQEAAGLERALRKAQKPELLERALQRRLEHAADPREAARALESLSEVATERIPTDRAFRGRVLEHAERAWEGVEGSLLADSSYVEASKRLVGVFRRLGEGKRVAAVLSSLAACVDSEVEKFALELEAARELLDVPAARGEAIGRLRILVDRNPSDEDAFALLCRTLEDDGQLEEVLGLFRKRIESGASDPEDEGSGLLRLELAGLLERAGRAREAIETYEALAAGARFNTEALRALAHLEENGGSDAGRLCDAGRLSNVLERLVVLEHGPSRAAVALRLLALRSEHDPAADERLLSLGFFADPTHPDLRERLVGLYLDQGQWRKAATVLERAVEAIPSDTSLRLRLSDALVQDGDTDGALRALVFVAEGADADIERARRRFLVQKAAGRLEAAAEELDAVVALDGRYGSELLAEIENAGLAAQSERWALRYADLLVAENHPDVAMSSLRAWLGAHPGCLPALRRLSTLAWEVGDLPMAIDLYGRLLEDAPLDDRPALALELASIYDSANRTAEATTALEIALAECPDHLGLRRRLRSLYAKSGATRKEAEMLLEEATREREPQPRVELLLEAAGLFCRMGATAEALQTIDRVRAEAPDRTEGVVLQARILLAEEKQGEALSEIERFLNTYNPRPSKALSRLYRQLAEIHLAGDDLVEAWEALGQAHRMNKADPEVAFLLGLLAVDLDELEVANSALRTFLAIKAESSELVRDSGPSAVSRAHYHLACIEHTKGHHTAAKRMALRAVEEGPENRAARQLLEKLSAPQRDHDPSSCS